MVELDINPDSETLTSGKSAVLHLEQLSFCYPDGKQALKNVDLCVYPGELVVILGSNGSGKSTMLRCVVRMLQPETGNIFAAGHDMVGLYGRALRQARTSIGMIGQQANLVRRRSVLANVMAGALSRNNTILTSLGLLPKAERERAFECLSHVDLMAVAHQRADTLSGGQAQRVSIARVLMQQPKLILADEPVASLDPEAATGVMRLLRRLANEGLAVVCILHQPDLARQYADRVVGLANGQLHFTCCADQLSEHEVAKLYGRSST